MSPRATKSRHLDKYIYFLSYDGPGDIPFDGLAKQLGVHPNLLRGMIRNARSNSTIYLALRKMGYQDQQIPKWFARPDEPPVNRWAAPAGPKVSAENRSVAEVRSEPYVRRAVRSNVGVVQGRSAERPSALSLRSAPPAYTHRRVQPVYQPTMSPMLKEAYQLFRETQEEEMRDILNQMKERRAPPRPLSPVQLNAMADMNRIGQQIKLQNAVQMVFMRDMLQSGRNSEPIDIEEMKNAFTKPFEEMKSQEETRAREWKAAIRALGQLYEALIPNTGSYEVFQKLQAAIPEKRKRDRHARMELVKIMAENRKRKNIDLEILEHQNRILRENIWKNLNRGV